MKLSLPDRRTRLLCLLAMASLTAGACVQPDPPSVGIKSLAADIVFGATPIEEEETQPTTFEPPATETAAQEIDELPPQVFAPPAPKTFPTTPFRAERPKTTVVCPDAAIDEFPDITAPLNVPADALPKEGLYRWKKSGTREVTRGVMVPVTGFEERAIRNVTVGAADPASSSRRRFTFEMVQPFGDGLAVTKYAVDTAARSSEVNNTLGEQRVTAGEPERGVVIDSVTYTDSGGTAVRRPFSPVTGLLLTPLPIRTGEMFQSVAVDPATQQTWRYDAQLTTRDRVDACGEMLEGWRTNGTLTVTGGEGGMRKFSVIVAPQFGGLPLLESSKGTDAKGLEFDITYTIGQLEPSPFKTAG